MRLNGSTYTFRLSGLWHTSGLTGSPCAGPHELIETDYAVGLLRLCPRHIQVRRLAPHVKVYRLAVRC